MTVGTVCGMRILEVLAPPGLNEINIARVLPPLGVLCAVRGVDSAIGVTGVPETVAAPLISDPCELSCCSIAVVTVPVPLVTTVGAHSAATTRGP